MHPSGFQRANHASLISLVDIKCPVSKWVNLKKMEELAVPRTLVLLIGLSVALFGWKNSGIAQETAPKITVGLKSSAELLSDLKFILSLTSDTEQKQWPILKDYIEIFLPGIDRQRPIEVDVILGGKEPRYRMSFPLSSLRKFRKENLDSLGIKSRRKRRNRYRLTKAVEGWLLYKNKYGIIADLPSDLPADLPDPQKKLAPFLAGKQKYDIVLDAVNQSDGQEARRKWFAGKTTELLAAIKPKKDEDPDTFALRKLLVKRQLAEGEWYYAETLSLRLGWTTDVPGKKGRLDIKLVPIPKSSLAKSIAALGQKPGFYANIPRHADSILSMRLNHPLDELRKTHLLELYGPLSTVIGKKIDKAKDLSDAEKAARHKLIKGLFDLLTAGTKAGLAEAFVEVHANTSGPNTLVGAMRTADGAAVVELVKLVSQIGRGNKSELNVDKEGNVAIHKVLIPAASHPQFKKFFGSDFVLIGTSKDMVWGAAGENAMEELKAAIKLAAKTPRETKNKDVFGSLFVKLGPWIKFRKPKADKKPKDDLNLRKLALEAFAGGDDTLTLEMKRVDDHVEGHFEALSGILRLAGKLIADFSHTNLDDSSGN